MCVCVCVVLLRSIRQPSIGTRTFMADHPYPADGSDIPKERARAGSSSAGGRVHGFLHEAESRSDPYAVAELPPEEGQLQESRQEFYHRSHGNECSPYLLYIIALWNYAHVFVLIIVVSVILLRVVVVVVVILIVVGLVIDSVFLCMLISRRTIN